MLQYDQQRPGQSDRGLQIFAWSTTDAGAKTVQPTLTVTNTQVVSHPGFLFYPGIIGYYFRQQIILTRQEYPDHPRSYLKGYPDRANNVRPPITNIIMTRQEEPRFHPSPLLLPPKPGPDVANYIQRIITTMETPFHPQGFMFGRFPTDNVGQGIVGKIMTVQEQPWHPQSRFQGSHFTGNVVFGINKYLMTSQEYPVDRMKVESIFRYTFQPRRQLPRKTRLILND